jgi:hypothetical protein
VEGLVKLEWEQVNIEKDNLRDENVVTDWQWGVQYTFCIRRSIIEGGDTRSYIGLDVIMIR